MNTHSIFAVYYVCFNSQSFCIIIICNINCYMCLREVSPPHLCRCFAIYSYTINIVFHFVFIIYQKSRTPLSWRLREVIVAIYTLSTEGNHILLLLLLLAFGDIKYKLRIYIILFSNRVCERTRVFLRRVYSLKLNFPDD